jgi:membrane-associated phospholipid phosphatase
VSRRITASWRIVCLASLGLFLVFGLAAFATGTLPGDVPLRRELLDRSSESLTAVARAVNHGGRTELLLPATLLLLWLSPLARERWWLWSGVQLASGALEHAFKFLVGRPRPSGQSLGYPSGHTTAATTFAIIMIYFSIRGRLTPRQRRMLQAAAVLLMVAVGWARIMLRAHWPSDVLGGFLLGTCCAAAAAWWNETHPVAPAGAASSRP